MVEHTIQKKEVSRLVHLYEEPPHALSGPTSSLKPQTKPKLLTIAPKVSSFSSEFHKKGEDVLYKWAPDNHYFLLSSTSNL